MLAIRRACVRRVPRCQRRLNGTSRSPTELEAALKQRTPLFKLYEKDDGVPLVGQHLRIAGWIRSHRIQGAGRFAFVNVHDGTHHQSLQAVVPSECEGFSSLSDEKCGTGASVLVEGELVASQGGKQKVEMQVSKFTLIGPASSQTYPLSKGRKSLEFLRNLPHIRCRSNALRSVAAIRNILFAETHQYFQNKGYFAIQTPIMTRSDCEGAGDAFVVEQRAKKDARPYFPSTAYLTVSGQLNAEAIACGMSNVYTFGPTFRAERSSTSRHLAEFWMVEPEIAFADVHEAMDCCEGYVRHMLSSVLKRGNVELEQLEMVEGTHANKSAKKGSHLKAWFQKKLRNRLQELCDAPFKRMTYYEAVKTLIDSKKKFAEKPEQGKDLHAHHEAYLTSVFGAVFVYDWPANIKAFYMMENDDEASTVRAFDLLVPGVGELAGGAQREHRLDVLKRKMDDHGLDAEDYKWYLQLREWGTVPHAGYGVGFDRAVQLCTAMENIRDVIPFPVYHEHLP